VTNKDNVLSRYPHACVQRDNYDPFLSVWDIDRDEQRRRGNKFWSRRACGVVARQLLGLGRTEKEAWADAVKRIEQQEGIKL